MIMDDETFARIVADNVKNRSTSVQNRFLEAPENSSRWQAALGSLIKNIDEQIQEISMDAQADMDRYSSLGDTGNILLSQTIAYYEVKKQKIERFRYYVIRKLADVASAGKNQINGAEQENLSLIAKAVERHRELGSLYKIEKTPLDTALYDSLNGVWSFDNINHSDLEDFSEHAPSF